MPKRCKNNYKKKCHLQAIHEIVFCLQLNEWSQMRKEIEQLKLLFSAKDQLKAPPRGEAKKEKRWKKAKWIQIKCETATRLHRLLKILNILMCLIYWTFCMLKRCSSVQQGDLIVALMSSSQPWQSLSSAWGFLKCNSLLRSLDDSHIRLIFFSQTQTREKSNEHLAFTGSDNEVSFTTLRLNTPAQWDQILWHAVTTCDTNAY